MADRSPEGELEIAGGCLRFLHQCNWKMFVENLNDTMHPMVVHESSAGTAKRMWDDKPADAPKPMAIEQFVPFVSDYKFFEDMGVRVYRQRPQLLGRALQHPQRLLGDRRLRGGDEGGVRRGARARRSSASRATTRCTTRA